MTPTTAKAPGLLLIISGPSGVGKTTITHHVERALGGEFSVSVTTRPKTDADVEGRDYYFISVDEFMRRREHGDLLEWAEVFGHYYGTPREPVQQAVREGRLMILEIDVEGGVQIKKLMPEAFGIFVMPPNERVLLERLHGRKREDEAVIQRRFAKAKYEIVRAWESGVYDEFIVNRDLDHTVNEALSLVKKEMDRDRPHALQSKK